MSLYLVPSLCHLFNASCECWMCLVKCLQLFSWRNSKSLAEECRLRRSKNHHSFAWEFLRQMSFLPNLDFGTSWLFTRNWRKLLERLLLVLRYKARFLAWHKKLFLGQLLSCYTILNNMVKGLQNRRSYYIKSVCRTQETYILVFSIHTLPVSEFLPFLAGTAARHGR